MCITHALDATVRFQLLCPGLFGEWLGYLRAHNAQKLVPGVLRVDVARHEASSRQLSMSSRTSFEGYSR